MGRFPRPSRPGACNATARHRGKDSDLPRRTEMPVSTAGITMAYSTSATPSPIDTSGAVTDRHAMQNGEPLRLLGRVAGCVHSHDE